MIVFIEPWMVWVIVTCTVLSITNTALKLVKMRLKRKLKEKQDADI